MAHVRPASTVESALRASDQGMPDAQNALLHGVAVKTIRRWRRRIPAPRPPARRSEQLGALSAVRRRRARRAGLLRAARLVPRRRSHQPTPAGLLRPCLFPQHGPGRKHERALELADWQRAIVAAYPADFLRGLFHSDGCRVQNWATRRVGGEVRRYEYPRWQFVNESADIMRWCGEVLDLAGVPWRQTSRRTLSVSRREAVALLDSLIGPKA